MLIILLIASVCAGLYAWSKYITTVEGTATSQTAKWNFKLKGNSTDETGEEIFALLRTDNNTSVVSGKLAPRNIWGNSINY